MPSVTEALLETFEGGNVDIQKQARLVSYDPVLSTRLLAMAYVSQDRTPQALSLQRALAMMDPMTVRTLVVTFAIQQSFHLNNFPIPALQRFWQHSLRCAHLAQRLAEVTANPGPEIAYLAGLLHDLGKLILSARQTTAPEEAHTLSRIARTLSEIPRIARTLSEVPELEQRLLGADHCTLGAELLSAWKLPVLLSDAIRFHHLSALELRGAHSLFRLLHTANVLSQETECSEALLAEEGDLLGLSPAALKQARVEIEAVVGSLITELSIAVIDSEGEATPARTQDPLQRKVRELALIDTVRSELSNADDASDLQEAVTRCAALLFDLTDVRFFQFDAQTKMLRASFDAWLDNFTIDLAGATNAFQRAMQGQRICHSLEAEISPGVVDRQLARQWGSQGVWCLPLYAGDRPIGLLAAGISRAQLPRLQAREHLLQRFAAATAKALDERDRRAVHQHCAREDRELLEQQHLRVVLHEVSNPLTIVRNSLYVLATKTGEQVAEELQALQEEMERASRLLQRLAEPRESPAKADFDLNKTVRDLARVLDEALCRSHHVSLTLNLKEGLAPLARGRDAVQQILLNLVRNAAEALGEGGHITVTTQDGVNLHGRRYVEIAIADDGPGLPEALRAALFQPVVSTKGEGHAGLGLSIVKNLVEELGGQVIYRPNPGGGTVFLALLPQN
ncbi:MAG: HDOD domain-containing protein [Gammaproteobacteria bacterium]|nr:HDOD domain-containing protein [Gammaproteobacteria bacterium]MCP5195506.1 HDOD domain-containing protein [Gammaproteobacteria bacterium]